MEIGSIRHKSLRRFYDDLDARGLNAQIAPRLSRMFQFLEAVQSIEELQSPPNYGAHQLKGDRKGIWALTVTRNWRMTFELTDDLKVMNMDLEDYHGA
jgi:proteic killer suppression protein